MNFDKPIEFDVYDNNHWKTAMHDDEYGDDKVIDLYSFYELMGEKQTINLCVEQTAESREYLHDSISEGNSISSDVFRHGLWAPEYLMANNFEVSYKNFIANDGSYKKVIRSFGLKSEDHLKAFFDSTLPANMEKINHLNVSTGKIYDLEEYFRGFRISEVQMLISLNRSSSDRIFLKQIF